LIFPIATHVVNGKIEPMPALASNVLDLIKGVVSSLLRSIYEVFVVQQNEKALLLHLCHDCHCGQNHIFEQMPLEAD
jgi:hypothetical protein